MDTQVNNFISTARADAENMKATIAHFRATLEQWQKLGYSPAVIDANKAGDNEDITGAQIDLAMAAMNDFITTWNGNAGTYLLEITR